MKFEQGLLSGRLIRRYKRFLADVVLDDGNEVIAHCPNTGGMLGCQEPGSQVWLRYSDNPKRKLAYSWELVECDAGALVGIYSAKANALIEEAWRNGVLAHFGEYTSVQREVKVGDSRLDFCFKDSSESPDCYVEVKSVTASTEQGVALFPDAKTQRGVKHLNELMELKKAGFRVAMVFCVQRDDISVVRPAAEFDFEYAMNFAKALESGVEAYAVACKVTPEEIVVERMIEVRLS